MLLPVKQNIDNNISKFILMDTPTYTHPLLKGRRSNVPNILRERRYDAHPRSPVLMEPCNLLRGAHPEVAARSHLCSLISLSLFTLNMLSGRESLSSHVV